jgi:hypothetical protein
MEFGKLALRDFLGISLPEVRNRQQCLLIIGDRSPDAFRYSRTKSINILQHLLSLLSQAKRKSWNTSPVQYLFADSFPELGEILNAKLYPPSHSEEKMQI